MNGKNWITILISFISGFIVAYITIYHIGQEDNGYTVEIDNYYKFCDNEFYTNDYIDGFMNDFDLKQYIQDINDYCI